VNYDFSSGGGQAAEIIFTNIELFFELEEEEKEL